MNQTRRHTPFRSASILAATLLMALSVRPSAVPRLQPLSNAEWTDVHRELVTTYWRPTSGSSEQVPNDFRVWLRHPALVRGVLPFATYISEGSTLSPRHRQLLILRTAWLCRSQYEWASHVPRARTAGLTAQELRRIAAGPDEPGWDTFEAALIRMADELHVDSFVSDATWKALTDVYNTHQIMDAVFTVAELTMLSEAVNSIGVEPDSYLTDRLPTDVPYRLAASRTGRRLIGARPRIEPLEPAQWTPAVRTMLDPSGSGRAVAAVYRTLAQHPRMYSPRQLLSEYIRTQATLEPRVRELLIMRIGVLCGSDYEWAAHAPAGRRAGMSEEDVRHVVAGPIAGSEAFDDTLLRAVDELYSARVISDATWGQLAARFNDQQLLDVLITTGGYHMVSMALNTFGVQLEPGGERIPERRP